MQEFPNKHAFLTAWMSNGTSTVLLERFEPQEILDGFSHVGALDKLLQNLLKERSQMKRSVGAVDNSCIRTKLLLVASLVQMKSKY